MTFLSLMIHILFLFFVLVHEKIFQFLFSLLVHCFLSRKFFLDLFIRDLQPCSCYCWKQVLTLFLANMQEIILLAELIAVILSLLSFFLLSFEWRNIVHYNILRFTWSVFLSKVLIFYQQLRPRSSILLLTLDNLRRSNLGLKRKPRELVESLLNRLGAFQDIKFIFTCALHQRIASSNWKAVSPVVVHKQRHVYFLLFLPLFILLFSVLQQQFLRVHLEPHRGLHQVRVVLQHLLVLGFQEVLLDVVACVMYLARANVTRRTLKGVSMTFHFREAKKLNIFCYFSYVFIE